MDGFFRILEKTSFQLICTRLYIIQGYFASEVLTFSYDYAIVTTVVEYDFSWFLHPKKWRVLLYIFFVWKGGVKDSIWIFKLNLVIKTYSDIFFFF